jgi:DeoR family transcriptional regulator, fructose operon transcriptional repressor
MLAIQRREMIKKEIELKGEVLVAELSKVFKVSDSTIRRDLDVLASQQVVTKTYGGAVIHERYSLKEEPLFTERESTNFEQKQQIAMKAASLVEDGDVIILDNGTTTSLMVQFLQEKQDVTVITNSINIAYHLMSNPTIEIIVLGGRLRNRTGAIVGDNTLLALQSIWANKVFLSCSGVSLEGGVTVSNMNSMELRKQMIQSAQSTILLADTTKVGKRFIAKICSIQEVTTLITNHDFEEKKIFNDLGVNVFTTNDKLGDCV